MFRDARLDIGGAGVALNRKVAKRAFRELEVYLSKPMEIISQEYWHREETEEKEKQSRVAKAQNKEEVLNYYQTTSRHLYALTYWEGLKSKQIEFRKVYLFCRKMKVNTLLDFGGGIGGLSIFMAQRGLRCDYLDVPGKTSDFAQWRFKQRSLEAKLYLDAKALPASTYEGVIGYDVLEHLFDVEEAIKQISFTLKNKGYFITRSAFSEGGAHLAKNTKFQDMNIFNAMMRKHNFSFLGQLKPDYFSQFLRNLGLRNVAFGVRIKKRLKYGGNFTVYQKLYS